VDLGPEGSSIVTLSFQNLQRLEGGLNYQAWVVQSDNGTYRRYPMAIFNVDENGQTRDPMSGALIGEIQTDVDPIEVFAVQVTIEYSETMVSSASSIYLLGGFVSEGTGELTVDSELAVGIFFEAMTGKYTLMTPTDDDKSNEFSGIWFAQGSEDAWEPGLFLPPAPDGWVYEGWVAQGSDTLSTGKFFSPETPDPTDLYGGGLHLLPVPGQDYLKNPPEGFTFPMDFSGGYVLVTLEPWNEFDVLPAEPFPWRLFEADIPTQPVAQTIYGLTSLYSSFPTGTVVVRDP
jgi:hypothetical protein